jgi:hypothetical protein
MIPGGNILGMALRAIKRQSFKYYAFNGRELNDTGLYVASYKAPVVVSGSVQPVPRNLYQVNGLDFQKNYWNFFLERAVLDVARDVSGDQMEIYDIRFQCLSRTPWASVDGWDQVLCVQVDEVSKCATTP